MYLNFLNPPLKINFFQNKTGKDEHVEKVIHKLLNKRKAFIFLYHFMV